MKHVTIVYEVTDMAEFHAAGNPLRLTHPGLKAHTVATYNAIAQRNQMYDELIRLKDLVGQTDFDLIESFLASLK